MARLHEGPHAAGQFRGTRNALHAAVAMALASCGVVSGAQAADYVWQGGAGTWTDLYWGQPAFPNDPFAAVYIRSVNNAPSLVSLGTSASVGTLVIGGGDVLTVTNSNWLTLYGSTLTNDGSLVFDSTGNWTGLLLGGDLSLAGSGTTKLQGDFASIGAVTTGAVKTLAIGAGHTVEANATSAYLGYSAPNGANGELRVVNQGSVQVAAGKTLSLYLGDPAGAAGFDNTAGTVRIADGASLYLASGTVKGGVLQGTGSAAIAGGSGTFRDVTLQGSLNVLTGQTATVAGTITNNGTLTMNGVGNFASLLIGADTLLTGSGTTKLQGDFASIGAVTTGAVKTLTIGTGHTLEANATNTYLGYSAPYTTNGELRVVNQGSVQVDAGKTLSLYLGDPAGAAGFDNTAGTLRIADGASLYLASGAFKGGVLQGTGSAAIAGGSGTFRDVTLQGSLNVLTGQTATVAGTITNNGTLTLNGVGNFASLLVGDNTLLTGSGTTKLQGDAASIGAVTTGSVKTLTIGAGHTVEANATSAYLGYSAPNGANGELRVVNQGSVQVDAGKTLSLYLGDPAGAAGFDNAAGTVRIADGASLYLSSGTVKGGVLQGTGSAALAGGSGTFRDVTLQGNLNVLTGQTATVAGTITNNGTLTMNGVGNFASLLVGEDTLLTGSGTTKLQGGFASIGAVTTGAVKTLTIGTGHTLEANATNAYLGYSAPYNFTGELRVVNQGEIRASSGTLTFSGLDLASSGSLTIANGATIQQSGGTVRAQTINISSGGNYALSSGRLQVATINGNFTQQGGTLAAGTGGGLATINGNYVLGNGALEINLAGHAPGTYDQFVVNGDATLTSGASLTVNALSGFSLAQGDVFDIMSVKGLLSGSFAGLGEGSTVNVGGNSLQLTYLGGTGGHDIELVSALTAGSVNYNVASSTNVAYETGSRAAPSGGAASQIDLKGLDVLSGGSFTLGANETLNLDNGAGTLNVAQGGVFSGNGIINGTVRNAGLVRIPIVALGQVTGGHVQITVADPVTPTSPPPPLVAPGPIPVQASTLVGIGSSFGSGGGGGGSGGGGSGGGGGGGSTPLYTVQTPAVQVKGTLAVDASLAVTGSYAQTSTGALRLFVGGNTPAKLGGSQSGGSYSQLFVGQAVSLDGTLEIVLQPELFAQFNYAPKVGDTFDFVTAAGGITLAPGLKYETFVTQAGQSQIKGLSLYDYTSGIASDPDALVGISDTLFSYALIDGGTVLEATLLRPITGASPVPLPPATWPLALSALALWRLGRRGRRTVGGAPLTARGSSGAGSVAP